MLTVFTLGLMLTAAFPQTPPKHPADATIPSDVLRMIRDDLEADDAKDCLEAAHTTFEQMLETHPLQLHGNGRPALLVKGFGPCLGGANNGPFLIYASFGTGWRKVFKRTGVEAKPRSTSTLGWRDLEFWQHESAFRSIRVIYKFNGERYRPDQCDVVQYADYEGHKFPKPVYEKCE
jgi:hypothetical protein